MNIFRLFSVCFLVAFLGTPPLLAGSQQHAEVEADSMEYDEKSSKITAKGHVNITYEDRKLKAHEVEYDQENDLIKAQTNIHFIDEFRNEYFADDAEVNGDLSEGKISELNGHLADKKALFSADTATLDGREHVILNNAAYTPCKVCPRKYNGKALWRITADKVTMDRSEHVIDYEDATLDFFDIPILYLPYFSHPSPEVKRRSGFLPFTYGQVSALGLTLETPYFFDIAPNMDFTFSPILTNKEGFIAQGEFRHLTERGSYEISGSITRPEARDLVTGNELTGREVRGHIEGKGKFSLSDSWSWGFDGARSTDRTYLDRYNFSNAELLTSKAYIEHVKNRDYINIRSITFQGLNEDDNNDTTPLVLPQIISHHEKKINFASSTLFLDTNSLLITRDTGAESRRISTAGGISIPYTTNSGHVFNLKGSLRGDIYSVENVIDRSNLEQDGFVGRFIPEAQLSWSFPLFKSIGNSRLFIEPLTDIIISPNGTNPDKISNEDSQALELTDINLFSNNRFSGVDQVEGGFRSNYGFRGSLSHSWANLGFLFGQTYRATIDNKFTRESGLDNHFSDYVGRVTMGNDLLDVFYRFRANQEDFKLNRSEVGADLKHERLSARFSYTILDEDNETFDRQEISASGGLKLTDHWSINGFARRDITDNQELGGWIDTGVGFIYENECLRVTTGIAREYTRDADIEPSTSYTVKIAFKGLGD